MSGRFDGGGAQERLHKFKEGVASAPTSRVHLLAEGSEPFQFRIVHNQNDGLASLFLSTAASAPLSCGLNCKVRKRLKTRIRRAAASAMLRHRHLASALCQRPHGSRIGAAR